MMRLTLVSAPEACKPLAQGQAVPDGAVLMHLLEAARLSETPGTLGGKVGGSVMAPRVAMPSSPDPENGSGGGAVGNWDC